MRCRVRPWLVLGGGGSGGCGSTHPTGRGARFVVSEVVVRIAVESMERGEGCCLLVSLKGVVEIAVVGLGWRWWTYECFSNRVDVDLCLPGW